MDKNPEQEKKFVVVRTDSNEKVAGPFTESDANKKAKDKGLKESSGNAGLAVKQVIHG
jgi:hypothetical protein